MQRELTIAGDPCRKVPKVDPELLDPETYRIRCLERARSCMVGSGPLFFYPKRRVNSERLESDRRRRCFLTFERTLLPDCRMPRGSQKQRRLLLGPAERMKLKIGDLLFLIIIIIIYTF